VAGGLLLGGGDHDGRGIRWVTRRDCLCVCLERSVFGAGGERLGLGLERDRDWDWRDIGAWIGERYWGAGWQAT
jgi:hypothetical protein